MKVTVIWRPNDDIFNELYDYYSTPCVYEEYETIRVFETKAHWVIVDDTNPSADYLLYIEKTVPLKLAIIATKRIIWGELTLNLSEEEAERCIELEKEYRNLPMAEREGEEGEMIIDVYFPIPILKKILD